MIELLILSAVFHVGTLLYMLYYPSKALTVGFYTEVGFLIFIIAQLSSIMAAYYFAKEDKPHLSILMGVFLLASGILYDVLKIVSTLINNVRGTNFLPFFGPSITIVEGISFEYFYLSYLSGLLVIGFTIYLSRFVNQQNKNGNVGNKRFLASLRAKLVAIHAQSCGVLEAYLLAAVLVILISVILVLGISSYLYFSGYFVHFIVINIFGNVVSLVVAGLIVLAAIQKQWFHIDNTKLFIRKNTMIFASLTSLVLFTLEDVAYITFFARSFSTEPFYWFFRDTLINSLYVGLIYMLIGLGITLVYKILKFANFAQAELVTIGGYLGFLFSYIALDLGMFQAFDVFGPAFRWILIYLSLILFAFLFTIPFGIIFDRIVFKPLRDRKAEPLSIMIASFGLGIAVREILRQIFTSKVLKLNPYLENIGLDDTLLQIYIILSILLITWAIYLLLYRTKLGKILRAVADNPQLAQTCGITPERTYLYLWIIAAGFAGVAGMLFSSYQIGSSRIRPELGFFLLLSAFAVVILGGIGSFEGLLLAAIIIGFTENFGSVVLVQLGSLDITFPIPVLLIPDLLLAILIIVIAGIIVYVSQYKLKLSQVSKPFTTAVLLGVYIVVLFSIGSFLPILGISVDSIVASLEFGNGYRLGLTFGILILVLLVRPQGIFGEKTSGDR